MAYKTKEQIKLTIDSLDTNIEKLYKKVNETYSELTSKLRVDRENNNDLKFALTRLDSIRSLMRLVSAEISEIEIL